MNSYLATAFLRHQKHILLYGVLLISALAWVYILIIAANMMVMQNSPGYETNAVQTNSLGPGTAILEYIFADQINSTTKMSSFWDICTQVAQSLSQPLAFKWLVADYLLILVMWVIMIIAMMLPTTLPTLSAFLDLCKNHQGESSLAKYMTAFIGGYILAWGLFSAFAAILQLMGHQFALLSQGQYLQSALLGGIVLIISGLYQISTFKDHCLTQCRNPIMFFMQYWQPGLKGSLKMGFIHGLYCIGCCIGLMMVMFFAGLMNILWMFALGLVMMAEKVLPEGQIWRYGSAAFISAWGIFVILQTP